MSQTIGLTEDVTIYGKKEIGLKARIDTGATASSLDIELSDELCLGPITRQKRVRSAHGTMLRPVVECEILLAGRRIKGEFTLANRKHMKYKMLIGQNILRDGFLIDPSRE